MSYINGGLGLFILSLSLFLIAMSLGNKINAYIFIIAGLIIQFVGVVMLLTGAIKRYKEAN